MTVYTDPEKNETKYLHKLADFARKNVLEIGCGDGRLAWLYASKTNRTVGIDPDAEALRLAIIDRPSDLEKKVSFHQASSLSLPFSKETFDLAVLSWSL